MLDARRLSNALGARDDATKVGKPYGRVPLAQPTFLHPNHERRRGDSGETARGIKPEPRNARTHSKKQVAEIAASIQQFGFANPLLVDVNGVLIAGHGRLLAAKSIGLDMAPTITLPHLNEAQRRALRLADNKIALNAGWDKDLLKLELKELADLEIDFDLSLTGFSTGEIDVLLASKGRRHISSKACASASTRRACFA